MTDREKLEQKAFHGIGISARQLLNALDRIERMEAVVEAARSYREAVAPYGFKTGSELGAKLDDALTAYDTAEAIARGDISPDEAPLVDPEDE